MQLRDLPTEEYYRGAFATITTTTHFATNTTWTTTTTILACPTASTMDFRQLEKERRRERCTTIDLITEYSMASRWNVDSWPPLHRLPQ